MSLVVTIMAAGKGTRMNSDIPKVLVPFLGIPMIVRIILTVRELNAREIIIIVSRENSNIIKNTILDKCGLLGIRFVTQENQLGTGDSIKCSVPYYNDNDNVLILNGDMPAITTNILSKFIKSYYYVNILSIKVNNPYGYGRIILDEKKNFKKIVEENECTDIEKKEELINIGIYYISAKILKDHIGLINNVNSKQEYYITDIFEIIRDKTTILINNYELERKEKKYILGVNTMDELIKLEDMVNHQI